MADVDDPRANLGVVGRWMVRHFWLFIALLAGVVVAMVVVTLLLFEHKANGLWGILVFLAIAGPGVGRIARARTAARAELDRPQDAT